MLYGEEQKLKEFLCLLNRLGLDYKIGTSGIILTILRLPSNIVEITIAIHFKKDQLYCLQKGEKVSIESHADAEIKSHIPSFYPSPQKFVSLFHDGYNTVGYLTKKESNGRRELKYP